MLELVKYSEKHRDSLVRLLNNENIAKWLLRPGFPYTYKEADWWINRCRENENSNDDFSYAIENDNVHIGGIGLHRQAEHAAEVGYWIDETQWQKGYATEALMKILNLAFDDLKLSRVSAHTFEGNIASERLLLKCGFHYEGFLRKLHKKGDVFINSKLFSAIV
jgi:RimJ/RimL family protein N-acetyltransferase